MCVCVRVCVCVCVCMCVCVCRVLVGQGALVVRDVGSWWFSIPGVSTFLTSLTKGWQA